MGFRPFYIFVRQFVCNLKIPLRNSVITPFIVLNTSIAGCPKFWWWKETEQFYKSILFTIQRSIPAPPYQLVQLNCDLKKLIH